MTLLLRKNLEGVSEVVLGRVDECSMYQVGKRRKKEAREQLWLTKVVYPYLHPLFFFHQHMLIGKTFTLVSLMYCTTYSTMHSDDHQACLFVWAGFHQGEGVRGYSLPIIDEPKCEIMACLSGHLDFGGGQTWSLTGQMQCIFKCYRSNPGTG